jgi:hypothetical protein
LDFQIYVAKVPALLQNCPPHSTGTQLGARLILAKGDLIRPESSRLHYCYSSDIIKAFTSIRFTSLLLLEKYRNLGKTALAWISK